MNSKSREIILVNQISKEHIDIYYNLQQDDIEYFMLNPAELFKTIDWTKFEEDIDVLNSIYAILFDEFVIARKKFLCYWPSHNYSVEKLLEINKYCQDARVGLEVEMSHSYMEKNIRMLPEYESLWSSFILFLVESLCEDIKLNEEIEEIATLKCENESVMIFSIRENELTRYFYIKSQVTIFEVEGALECYKQGIRGQVPLFSNFNELIDSLQDEINIRKFSTNFSNSSIEKQYYRAICQNFNSYNLVQQWMSNFYQN